MGYTTETKKLFNRDNSMVVTKGEGGCGEGEEGKGGQNMVT